MTKAPELSIPDRLRGIHSALDDALGDTDVEHMDDEKLRDAHPTQWAAAKLAQVITEINAARNETLDDASRKLLDRRDSLHRDHKSRIGLELAAHIVRDMKF